MRGRSVGALVVAGLIVAVIIGGLASLYASGEPDGLNRVAADEGIAAEEQAHDLEDGPFAGYEASGIDGSLSGGVAAVVGISATFLVAGGLSFALRRRHHDESTTGSSSPAR